MSAIRKLFSPWMALLAIVAVGTTTSAARADLFLEIEDTSTFKKVYVDLGNPKSGATTTTYTNSTTFSGYSISATATQSSSKGSASLTLAAAVSNIGGKDAQTFDFTLVTSTATKLGGTTAHPALPSGATSGFFTTPLTSGTGTIALTPSVYTPVLSAGSSSVVQSGYTDYGQGGASPFTGSSVASSDTASISTTATGSGDTLSQSAGANSFDLQVMQSITVGNTIGTAVATGTTKAIAVPEASGITAALAGLPCFGLLVGLVRRNRSQLAPVLAA
jgi:hypothetical protein